MLQKLKRFFFSNTSTRQTLAKNTFWLAVTNVGGRLIRSLIIIYAARVLGASEWGAFSYAISLVAFITIFTDLGISPILTRETVKNTEPEKQAQILSTAFVIKLALVLIGFAATIFLAPYFSKIEGVEKILVIVAFVFVFDSLREFGSSLTRAMERMEWEAGLFLLTNAAILFFGFVFLKMRPSVVSFSYAYAVGTGIGMAATFWTFRENFRQLLRKFSRKMALPILSSAWPLAISGIMGALMINTDIVMIGYFRSVTEVGYYSAAQRLIQILYLTPGILAMSLFPLFARLAHQKEKGKMRLLLEKSIGLSFLIALPMTFGGIIISSPLISAVFGSSYLPSNFSFQILLLSILTNFPAVILSNALFAYDRQKDLVKFSAIGGIGNLVFDIILIPAFGITGSAVATLFAQTICNVYLWHKTKQVGNFRVMFQLKNIILATAVMSFATLVLSLLGVNAFLILFASAAVYFGLLYLAREPLLWEIKSMLRAG